jgi:spore maturation protein CgeB
MKILLIAPETDMTLQIRNALDSLGHRTQYLNDRGLAHHRWLWWCIRHVQILRRLRNTHLNARILKVAESFRPDLVLVCKGMTITAPTLHRLRALGIRTANWFPENGRREPYKSWLDRFISAYDYFFVFDSAMLERQAECPDTRIVFLPFGVEPQAYDVPALTASDHERYDTDICFVGAHYPERERMLTELTGWNIKIFGWHGWERTSLARYYQGPLNVQESAKAYRCAKIVLNMNLEPPVNGVNAKTFEICAAGGFQLTDWRADLPRLFQPDQEVIVFHDLSELKRMIGHYLDDAGGRMRIARAGYERVKKEHTLRQRMSAMIASIA